MRKNFGYKIQEGAVEKQYYRTAVLGHRRRRYINSHRRLGLAAAREGSTIWPVSQTEKTEDFQSSGASSTLVRVTSKFVGIIRLENRH